MEDNYRGKQGVGENGREEDGESRKTNKEIKKEVWGWKNKNRKKEKK